MNSRDTWQRTEKPTVLDLREKHGIGIVQLADLSGVAPSIVYCMLLNRPINRLQATQVLAGLSSLAGVTYAIGDIEIAISEAGEEST